MNPKSNWHAVHEALVERRERMMADPPTAEELLAYRRGELAPEHEARIRELLVTYPALARAIAQTEPPEEPRPGEDDYIPEQEIDRRWKALRKRLRKNHREAGRVLQFFQISTAVAASLALAFGVMLWKARSELGQPRVAWEEQLLMPDGRRGISDAMVTLRTHGESVLLVAPLLDPEQYPEYRLELTDSAGDTLWTSAVKRRHNDTFAILVPRSFLGAGTYKILLYGVDGGQQVHLASYSLHVPRS
ncbi:MAG TPA: hypothetical protein VEK11_20965 [Thermoanaerobaculia bacterium]|nr:hypothetical protein [Thermoanaerobaculia bacterium]